MFHRVIENWHKWVENANGAVGVIWLTFFSNHKWQKVFCIANKTEPILTKYERFI